MLWTSAKWKFLYALQFTDPLSSGKLTARLIVVPPWGQRPWIRMNVPPRDFITGFIDFTGLLQRTQCISFSASFLFMSSCIRARVWAARNMQSKRFGDHQSTDIVCNADMRVGESSRDSILPEEGKRQASAAFLRKASWHCSRIRYNETNFIH